MTGPALAFLGALYLQAAPPPQAGTPAPTRRTEPLEVLPPEGPFGRDEFGLVWRNPTWRGFFLSFGPYSGDDLEMNAPRAIVARSNGVDPVLTAEMSYDDKDFDALGATATFDFDFFRLSAHFFFGDFDARGVLTTVDGVNPSVSTPVEVDGDFYGFRLGVHWPGIRLRSGGFEASIGPNLTVGWQHEEVDEVPGSPLPIEDSVDDLIGTLAPRLSIRVLSDRFAFTLEGEYGLQFGSSEGEYYEFSVGVGYKF